MKTAKYKGYTIRQDAPNAFFIVGATRLQFFTLEAAKRYVTKRL